MQHQAARNFAAELQEQCVGTRIGRLHRYAARCFDQQLRTLGMSMPQLEVLSMLVLRDAPVRPGEIARVLVAERSTVSRNLATLEQRGWVSAARTSPTGRSMTVSVTPDGENALAEARAAWVVAHQSLTDALGPEIQSTIDTWLHRLATTHRGLLIAASRRSRHVADVPAAVARATALRATRPVHRPDGSVLLLDDQDAFFGLRPVA